MKIIYIHQYFTTNEGSSGTRSFDVAKYMVEAGHQVSMICGISKVSGLPEMPWYKLFQREKIDGIDVIMCNVSYSNNFKSYKRMFVFFWFAFLAAIVALFVRKPDLVFATSTPLTVGIPGYIASKCKRVPFVFEVRDIWPESLILSGWVTGKELYVRMMARLEAFCYKKAYKILLVSDGFEKRLIERGLPPEKLKTILLGADGNIFRDIKPDNNFLDKYNLRDKNIAIFTGAHGRANGLDYIIDAAECSKERTDLAYVLIGSGSEKERLRTSAQSKGLDNVVFADPVSKDDLPGILSVCHVGLMILKHIEGGRPVTPNKIFDYMFAGIPSLVNFEGPTVDMVTADGSGLFVDPLKPEELAEKFCYLVDNQEASKEMGQKGYHAAWEKYDRKIIADQLATVFREALSPAKNGVA